MNGGGGRGSSDEDFGRCADGLAIIGVFERLQALVDKSDAQGRDDAGDGKCETGAAYRHNCRNLYPFGVTDWRFATAEDAPVAQAGRRLVKGGTIAVTLFRQHLEKAQPASPMRRCMIVVLSFFLPAIGVACAEEKTSQTTSNTMVLIATAFYGLLRQSTDPPADPAAQCLEA